MLEMPSSPGSCSFSPFPSAHADKMEEHVLTTPRRYFKPERLQSFLANAGMALCRAVFWSESDGFFRAEGSQRMK